MTDHRDAPFSACTGFSRDIRQAGYTPDSNPNSPAIARP
jgi:Tfp pilus assembly protein PilW